ncbi:acid protease [Peniophora sp. CONT]|nr:acid protease [Peniophora sp. CONT]
MLGYFFLGAASFAVRSGFALRISARKQALSPDVSFSSGKGSKARPISSNATTSTGDDGSTSSLGNFMNFVYTTNVTLGGSEFTLQLDTGSIDVVLVPDQPIETTLAILDHQPNSTYGNGYVAGPVAFAQLQFGEYTVESQAFLNGTSEAPFFDQALFSNGIRGIMGIGLDNGRSAIRNTLDEVYGSKDGEALSRTAINNVFMQNPELNNFTTVYLGRTGDGEATDEGIFTIGEYINGTEEDLRGVDSIDVFKPTSWGVPLDAMAVNGKKVALNSSLKGAPSGKAITLLDTGTGLAVVPPYVMDAMYSAYDGAYKHNGTWILPCLNGAPNITFTFSGREYYINPLDLTAVQTMDFGPSDTNYTFCIPAFNASQASDGLPVDLLLGDSFLRNVYTVFDYGSFTDDGDVIKSPSVKLLSLLSPDDSYSQYLSYRGKTLASLPSQITKAQFQSSDRIDAGDAVSDDTSALDSIAASASSNNSHQAVIDKLNMFGPVVIGLLSAIIAALVGLLVIGVVMCVRRGRSVGTARSLAPSYAPVPVRFKESEYKDEEHVRYNEEG